MPPPKTTRQTRDVLFVRLPRAEKRQLVRSAAKQRLTQQEFVRSLLQRAFAVIGKGRDPLS